MPAVIKRAGRRNVKKVQMKFNSRLKWCKFTGRKSFTLYSKPTNMHKLDVVVISTNLALEQISQFECLFTFFLLNEVSYLELSDKLNNRHGEHLNSNSIHYLNK